MKKILIIGNAGYIGSRLEKHLDDLHDVAGVDTEWFGAGSAKTIVKDYRNLPADVVKAADVIISSHETSNGKRTIITTGDVNGIILLHMAKLLFGSFKTAT